MKKKVILVIMAHPDDETFGMGGTIAHYVCKGIEVHLICATKGEVGEVEPKYLEKFKTVGDLRQAELECAAKVLGISKVYWLGYRDSGMQGSVENKHPRALSSQSTEQVANEILTLIRIIEPEIIVTFDPLGGYKHPDHIAVHRATKLAYQIMQKESEENKPGVANLPKRLFFHTFPRGFFRFWVRIIKLFGGDPEHYGKNKDINFLEITEVNYPVDVRINYTKELKIRNQAYLCHASQGGGNMRKGILSLWEKLFGAYDIFTQMFPEKKDRHTYHDLFYDL